LVRKPFRVPHVKTEGEITMPFKPFIIHAS